MSQSEVLKLLEKKNRWMSIKEINKHLEFNAAAPNLLKLYKQGLVFRKEKRIEGTVKRSYIFKSK